MISCDYIYQMVIGWCVDDLYCGEFIEFISKRNYDKIVDGKYFFLVFPYSNQKIVLFNENNDVIPLVNYVDDVEYDVVQKEYIKKIGFHI